MLTVEIKKLLANRMFCGNLNPLTKRVIGVRCHRGDRIIRVAKGRIYGKRPNPSAGQ
jgi:hypothetical protein